MKGQVHKDSQEDEEAQLCNFLTSISSLKSYMELSAIHVVMSEVTFIRESR